MKRYGWLQHLITFSYDIPLLTKTSPNWKTTRTVNTVFLLIKTPTVWNRRGLNAHTVYLSALHVLPTRLILTAMALPLSLFLARSPARSLTCCVLNRWWIVFDNCWWGVRIRPSFFTRIASDQPLNFSGHFTWCGMVCLGASVGEAAYRG